MKLEEITALLNGFGLYKIFLISYMCVLSAYGPFMSLGNAFFAAKSDHWCDVLPGENCSHWAEFVDNCTEVKRSMFLPPPDDEASEYPYSNCKQWDLPDGYVFDSPCHSATSTIYLLCLQTWMRVQHTPVQGYNHQRCEFEFQLAGRKLQDYIFHITVFPDPLS